MDGEKLFFLNYPSNGGLNGKESPISLTQNRRNNDMLIYKNDEEVTSLFQAFEKRTLSKENWTHIAHLTVALVYCLNHPFGVAKNLIRDGIYWLNVAHGTPNTENSGYHETLTCFWMTLVQDFLAKCPSESSLADLTNELAALVGDSQLPLKFYSRELLFSAAARADYVKPDLKPELDFGEIFHEDIGLTCLTEKV